MNEEILREQIREVLKNMDFTPGEWLGTDVEIQCGGKVAVPTSFVCSKCGHKSNDPTPYCPMCGSRNEEGRLNPSERIYGDN